MAQIQHHTMRTTYSRRLGNATKRGNDVEVSLFASKFNLHEISTRLGTVEAIYTLCMRCAVLHSALEYVPRTQHPTNHPRSNPSSGASQSVFKQWQASPEPLIT